MSTTSGQPLRTSSGHPLHLFDRLLISCNRAPQAFFCQAPVQFCPSAILATDQGMSIAQHLRAAAKQQRQGDFCQAIDTSGNISWKLLECVKVILHEMIEITRKDWAVLGHAPAWTHRWKALSLEAYDMYKGQQIDYGNVCYRTALIGFARLDPLIEAQMNWFILLWCSLNFTIPHPPEHALGMQGDIIEIVMQALRADDLFMDPLFRRVKELDTTFPKMLAELCSLCKALVVCRAYTYDKSVVGGE